MMTKGPSCKIFAVLFLSLAMAGCKVRQAGPFETRTLTAFKHRVTVGGGKDKNPLPATTDNIHRGQVAFSSYCFVCHGLDGQKTGVPFADGMSPPIPSLGSAEVQRYNDGQLHWIVTNGISPSGMPAAKGVLNDEEVWSIVLYLRNLPPAGSLGEPKAYSEGAALPETSRGAGKAPGSQ